tara:strand:+ start:657 stop:878 length:222 start_codon:yes stop_codon:yes gene_type:complete
MPLEDEMRREIKRLEEELFLIEKELKNLLDRSEQLIKVQGKKKRDIDILKSHFNELNGEPQEKKKIQTTLAGV